jgi:hypothetical protein
VAQIFLNYRSADEPFGVAMLDQELSRRFGTSAVFLASKSIELGTDFENEMFDAVKRSVALLVVMGRNWMEARRKDGVRCVDDPLDFVRREIVTALNLGKKVIPVRLDIDPPNPDDVPEVLRPAMAKQGIRVRFRSSALDIDHLVAKLRTEIPELRQPKPTPAAGQTSVKAKRIGTVNTFNGDFHVSGGFHAGG